MCIYTISIHSIYLVSDLEGSHNGDPLYGIIYRESVLFIGTQFSILYTSMYSPKLQLAVIHGLVTVGTPGRTERFQVDDYWDRIVNLIW